MKNFKRFAALVLVLTLMLTAFSACSKPQEEEKPDFAYKTDYFEIKLSNENESLRFCKIFGDKLYILTEEYISEKTVDEATGEELYNYFTARRLYSANADGSDMKEIPDFYNKTEAGMEYTDYRDICFDAEGNMYLIKNVSRNIFNFPAGVDENSENAWDYYVGSEETVSAVKLDENGKEAEEIPLVKTEAYIDSAILGADGNWYLGGYNGIYVYGKDGTELFKMENINNNGLITLSDGRVAAAMWDEGGYALKVIDSAKKGFGEKIKIPEDAYNFSSGSGGYDILYRTEASLFGYDIETETEEKLLSWLECDINSDEVNGVYVGEDGTVKVISNSWSDGTTSLITVEKVPAEEVKEKKTITLAAMYLSQELRNAILDFNRNSDTVRIIATDYSEFNTEEDYTLGLTRLNTEIISGNVPDIICTSELNTNRYAAKGLLEDLMPYIENDMGYDALVTPFFDALRTESGALYEVYSSFGINTLMGRKDVIGETENWTVDKLKELAQTLPEGASVMGESFTKSEAVLMLAGIRSEDFVNWETGECSFDNEEFVKILEFANTFPAEYDWQNSVYIDDSISVAVGRQLLCMPYISSFEDFIGSTFYILGDNVCFAGYPSENGGETYFSTGGTGLAMSSKCEEKEAAWEFIRTFLTEEFQEEFGWGSFPTNRARFEAQAKEAMTPEFGGYGSSSSVVVGGNSGGSANIDFELPAYRKPLVNEQGEEESPKMIRGVSAGENYYDISIYAMTNEEYSAIMELIESAEKINRYDMDIIEIMLEETQQFFAGEQSAEDTAKFIQSRVNLYVNEQR
ncbi:MAG: extracellular solute-binding protein [Oscillospiraceae bacterium]|nr:extracellular solute-binding protein [Oscillospiraceae bacterium]